MSLDRDSEADSDRRIGLNKVVDSYFIPERSLVVVEHPFIVRNLGRAIETLGGTSKVKKLLAADQAEARHAELCLRPGDQMTKSITSGNVSTNNILLRITIPKRTGRKRKRGSDGPFEYPSGPDLDKVPGRDGLNANSVLQSMRDNPDKVKLEAVGPVDQTHRFRSLPDFVWSTSRNAFMRKARDTLLTGDYDLIKKFTLDPAQGPRPNQELIPPPILCHSETPFPYSYHQNPAVRTAIGEDGKEVLVNDSAPPKQLCQRLTWDAPTVPHERDPKLPPIDSLAPTLQELILDLRSLLEQRPMWTRRALKNANPLLDANVLGKEVYQYEAYMFQSGPWRDAMIKLGVDPRSDPKYRVYQTLMFQLEVKNTPHRSMGVGGDRRSGRYAAGAEQATDETRGLGNRSHIFDGRAIGVDAKTWQVCDITDPLLRGILDRAPVREECHLVTDGWYPNGTWAKVRALMKCKLMQIYQNLEPVPEESLLRVAGLPDILNRATKDIAQFKGRANKVEIDLASVVRNLASKSDSEEKLMEKVQERDIDPMLAD